MPLLYRICKTKYAATAFDGEGARRYGGRRNSIGTRMVYAAGSLSLAILEILVHTEDKSLLSGYFYFEIDCPNGLITSIADIADLPPDWQLSPPPYELKLIGDDWINSALRPVLAVPSAIVPNELNYLLNSAHADFHQLIIGSPQSLAIDPRLTA